MGTWQLVQMLLRPFSTLQYCPAARGSGTSTASMLPLPPVPSAEQRLCLGLSLSLRPWAGTSLQRAKVFCAGKSRRAQSLGADSEVPKMERHLLFLPYYYYFVLSLWDVYCPVLEKKSIWSNWNGLSCWTSALYSVQTKVIVFSTGTAASVASLTPSGGCRDRGFPHNDTADTSPCPALFLSAHQDTAGSLRLVVPSQQLRGHQS